MLYIVLCTSDKFCIGRKVMNVYDSVRHMLNIEYGFKMLFIIILLQDVIGNA